MSRQQRRLYVQNEECSITRDPPKLLVEVLGLYTSSGPKCWSAVLMSRRKLILVGVLCLIAVLVAFVWQLARRAGAKREHSAYIALTAINNAQVRYAQRHSNFACSLDEMKELIPRYIWFSEGDYAYSVRCTPGVSNYTTLAIPRLSQGRGGQVFCSDSTFQVRVNDAKRILPRTPDQLVELCPKWELVAY
jgi:hypothetical protein